MDDNEEVKMGLNMMGFDRDVVEWLLGLEVNVLPQLNEIRRAVRLYGKGQHDVQSHVS